MMLLMVIVKTSMHVNKKVDLVILCNRPFVTFPSFGSHHSWQNIYSEWETTTNICFAFSFAQIAKEKQLCFYNSQQNEKNKEPDNGSQT